MIANPRKDTWIQPEDLCAVRRAHVEPSKQVKGAEQLAAAIAPAYQELLQKQAATGAKFEAKQYALDNFIFRDAEPAMPGL